MRPKPIQEISCIYNAMLNGNPCLFSEERVDPRSLNSTFKYLYDVRHDDTGEPCTIEKKVLVDYYGSIISPYPITEIEDHSTGDIIITDDDTVLDDDHYYANLDIDFGSIVNLKELLGGATNG